MRRLLPIVAGLALIVGIGLSVYGGAQVRYNGASEGRRND